MCRCGDDDCMHEDNCSDIWRPSDFLRCIAWYNRYGEEKYNRQTVSWMGPDKETCRVRRMQGLEQREEFSRTWVDSDEDESEEEAEEGGEEEEENEIDEWANVHCQAMEMVKQWDDEKPYVTMWHTKWRCRLESTWSSRLSEKEENANLEYDIRVRRDQETEARYEARMEEWCEVMSYCKSFGDQGFDGWSDDWRRIVAKRNTGWRSNQRQRTEWVWLGQKRRKYYE